MNTRFDMRAVAAALTSRAAEVAMAMLGEPNRQLSSKRELRFGRKGSLAVVTDGAKAGWWYDHEKGTGGDLFDLMRRQHGGGFRAAVEHAQRFIGHARTAQASSEASARCRLSTTDSVGNQGRALPAIEAKPAKQLNKQLARGSARDYR
jgi:hypothetical protein